MTDPSATPPEAEPVVYTASEKPPPGDPASLKARRELAAMAGEWLARFVSWSAHYRGCSGLIDKGLQRLRDILPPPAYEETAGIATRAAHVSALAAQALAVLFGIVLAAKASDAVHVAQGAGIVLLITVLQYTANRFLGAGRSLLHASQARLGSAAFTDSLALLSAISGILVFLGSIYSASEARQWGPLWAGLGLLIILAALAWIALCPAIAGARIAEGMKAGEEAIGILSFLARTLVAVTPIAMGVLVPFGTVGLVAGTVSLLDTGSEALAVAALYSVCIGLALPFLAYLTFIVYQLLADVLSAVLSIASQPGRRD
ncbi:MAG: hypothetical protein FJ224_13200 [Lentisphaerae bacterium]|nr:hypothetical protein [Lentisphaerota bacterium]